MVVEDFDGPFLGVKTCTIWPGTTPFGLFTYRLLLHPRGIIINLAYWGKLWCLSYVPLKGGFFILSYKQGSRRVDEDIGNRFFQHAAPQCSAAQFQSALVTVYLHEHKPNDITWDIPVLFHQ